MKKNSRGEQEHSSSSCAFTIRLDDGVNTKRQSNDDRRLSLLVAADDDVIDVSPLLAAVELRTMFDQSTR